MMEEYQKLNININSRKWLHIHGIPTEENPFGEAGIKIPVGGKRQSQCLGFCVLNSNFSNRD
jgi:hypothetical protein